MYWARGALAGLRNYGSILALPSVLRIWQTLGMKRVIEHNHQLVMEAGG